MAALNERGVLVVLWRWRRLPSAATRVWNARTNDLLRRGQGPSRQIQARNKPQPLEVLSSVSLLLLYYSSILPLVLGLFSGATLRLATAGPPSFCPALTAQAEPLFKQNRIPISTGCRSPCAPSAGIPDEMCDMGEVSRSSCRVEVHDGRPGWAGQVC